MSEVDPKSIKEIIAKADDVDLAAALARVSGRWRCTFCESDTLVFFPSLESIQHAGAFRLEFADDDHHLPTLALSCSNCGHISLFWPMPIIRELLNILKARNSGGGDHG